MKSMVVFFALASVACASWAPLWAQPPHHPAIVLDARGRPLDTAEVINARALHLQAKALEGHHGWVGGHGWHSPLALGYGGYGHGLYKRSLGHYALPAAVSHQSRVDVISSHGHHAAPVWTHAAVAPISHHHHHAAILPLASHGHGLTHINHAAVAPIGVGHGYNTLAHAW